MTVDYRAALTAEATVPRRVVDSSALSDYLGGELATYVHKLPAGTPLNDIGTYTWYRQDNFEKACRWFAGLVAAAKANLATDF